MRFSYWPLPATLALTAGGLSWIVKIGVIVATDGRVITSGPAAVLMSAGLVLLLLGAAGVGAGLAHRANAVARAGAALGAVAALVATCLALGMTGSLLFRDASPAYLAQEAGLFAAALVWFTVGAVALRGGQKVTASGVI